MARNIGTRCSQVDCLGPLSRHVDWERVQARSIRQLSRADGGALRDRFDSRSSGELRLKCMFDLAKAKGLNVHRRSAAVESGIWCRRHRRARRTSLRGRPLNATQDVYQALPIPGERTSQPILPSVLQESVRTFRKRNGYILFLDWMGEKGNHYFMSMYMYI